MNDSQATPIWSLYIIRRDDNALYTGITLDVSRRFKQHLNGTGAKALRGRSMALSYQVALGDKSLALRAEHRFKAMSKARKEHFLAQQLDRQALLDVLCLG